MPVGVPMGGEPRGGDDVFQAAPVSSGRRKQKLPYSPKTPLPSRAAGAGPSTPSAAAGRRQAAAESPSGSTSTTTTTNSPATPSLALSTTWTLYDNPCFCSSHFYPDLQHRHHRRRHHHHRKTTGASTTTPEKHSLGAVLERERAMVAMERERAILREEAEAVAEALRVELARERKRREEAEERARRAEEEGARWKEEVGRVEAEVRKAREAGAVLEQRVRAEMAEARGRFEEERRRLQMQIQMQMQVRPASGCGGDNARQCDSSKDQQQHKVQQHQVASPLATTPNAPPNPLTPHTTPSQTPKQRPQHQPRRDASPSPIENPHIRRGIIGFVEFPRVVGRSRTAPAKPGAAGPPKLECQKAQLRVLLKGGGGGKVAPVAGFPSSATPAHNLVM